MVNNYLYLFVTCASFLCIRRSLKIMSLMGVVSRGGSSTVVSGVSSYLIKTGTCLEYHVQSCRTAMLSRDTFIHLFGVSNSCSGNVMMFGRDV